MDCHLGEAPANRRRVVTSIAASEDFHQLPKRTRVSPCAKFEVVYRDSEAPAPPPDDQRTPLSQHYFRQPDQR